MKKKEEGREKYEKKKDKEDKEKSKKEARVRLQKETTRRKFPITRLWMVLTFFALLKIMVTYISSNEGTRCFLLPTLCARSFVSAG